jgi:hypothetical protein
VCGLETRLIGLLTRPVKGCRADNEQPEYFSAGFGDLSNVTLGTSLNGDLQVLYGTSATALAEVAVTFVCDPEMKVPSLLSTGETAPRHIELTYKSRCACLGLCDACVAMNPKTMNIEFSIRGIVPLLAVDPLGYTYAFSCDGHGLSNSSFALPMVSNVC